MKVKPVYQRLKHDVETCEICKNEYSYKDIDRHHVVPVMKGGLKGEIKFLCKTCHGKLHGTFTEKELAQTAFEEILETEEMQSYITWRRKHPTIVGCRMSNKVKEWKRGHR